MAILQTIKNKIVNATADVLSLPAQMKAGRVARQATIDATALKDDRKSGGNYIAPDPKNPAFVTRMNAIDARFDRTAVNNPAPTAVKKAIPVATKVAPVGDGPTKVMMVHTTERVAKPKVPTNY